MSRRRSSDDLVLLTDLSFQFFPGLVPLDQLSGHDFGDTTHLGFGVHYGPRQPHAFVGSVNTSAREEVLSAASTLFRRVSTPLSVLVTLGARGALLVSEAWRERTK